MILLRSDLVRAAKRLGTGARVAERSYVVRSLLAQDRASMLGWLAAEAGRQAASYLAAPGELQPVASWWHRRAATTADLPRELATASQA